MDSQSTLNALFFSYIHIRFAKKTDRNPWWLNKKGVDTWSKRYNMVSDVLYLVEEGTFDLLIDGQCHHVKAGQMLYLPSGVEFELKITRDQPLVCYWSHAELGFTQNKLNQLFQFPYVITPREVGEAQALFDRLIAAYHPESLRSMLEANALYLQLVSLYLKESEAAPVQETKRTSTLREITKYMSSNLHRTVTVKELAELTGYNPTYFSRKFKKTFEKYPLDYINDMKIRRAKEQLLYTALSVSEIAAGFGFSDVGYFTDLFKKKVGVTPAKFRSGNPWRGKI